jgi:hypothetical protein
MERDAELPRLTVGPHEYIVDTEWGELRAVSDRTKTIDLFKMDQEQANFSFWYNPIAMKLERTPAIGLPNHYVRVSFELRKVDPAFFKRVQTETNEAQKIILSGRSVYDKPGSIHESALEESGKNGPSLLPMVNIYGTEFFLDTRLKELRQVDNPINSISFKHLYEDEFHHILLFDPATKSAFNGNYMQARQSETAKLIVLPPMDLWIRDGIKRHEEKILRDLKTRSDVDRVTSSSRRHRKRIGL